MAIQTSRTQPKNLDEMQRLVSSMVQTCRSDDLVFLRDFFEAFPNLAASISRITQINIIVDANIILANIQWFGRKRVNPAARPILLELLVCKTVVAYAPRFLEEEIEKHLPRLSQEYSIPLEEMQHYWADYKSHIGFLHVDDASPEEIIAARDPKDIPYIKLQRLVEARIYSNDKDIESMGGRVITRQGVLLLRDYSRAAAVEYKIKLAGLSSMVISWQLIQLAIALIKLVGAQIRKMPPWLLTVGAGLIIAAIMHPKSKDAAMAWMKALPQDIANAGMVLLESITLFIEEHNKQQDLALLAISKINETQ